MKILKQYSSSFWFWTITIASIFSAWVITGLHNYFPYTGLSIAFMAISSIFFALKKEKVKFDKIIYFCIILLSLFIILRASSLLLFLNILAIIAAICLLINKRKDYNFIQLATSPLEGLYAFFKTSNQFKAHGITFKNHAQKLKEFRYDKLIISICITFILIIFIVPLLSSANPLFDKTTKQFLSFFSIEKFFNFLFAGNVILAGWRIGLSILFFVIFSRIATYLYTEKQETLGDKTAIVEESILALPKIIVAIIVFVFAITQLQLYFASDAFLRSLNYTHSKLVNEVFGQLLIVSAITIALVYNSKSRSKFSQILNFILIIEGLFLTFVGFKGDYDYSFIHGFTTKRLYGFTGIFWISATYILYIKNYIKQFKNNVFVNNFIILSLTTLLLINFLNFDYLVYQVRKPTVNNLIDYNYLSTLSTDASYYKDIVLSLNETVDKYGDKKMENWPKGYSIYMIDMIRDLQKKYKTIDFKTFNASEYLEYLSIKDISKNTLDKIQYLDHPYKGTWKNYFLSEMTVYIIYSDTTDLQNTNLKNDLEQIAQISYVNYHKNKEWSLSYTGKDYSYHEIKYPLTCADPNKNEICSWGGKKLTYDEQGNLYNKNNKVGRIVTYR